MYSYYRVSGWRWHRVGTCRKSSAQIHGKKKHTKYKAKEIWTFWHQQHGCEKRHVEDATVCITYETVCTHFHINRYEICQSTRSCRRLRCLQIILPSINKHIYNIQYTHAGGHNMFTPLTSNLVFFHNYVLPFSNAYGRDSRYGNMH